MNHYQISQWADYVRGMAEFDDLTTMGSHLEGCARCSRVVGSLRRVAGATAVERVSAPPAGTVRSVKAFFTLQQPGAPSSWRELHLGRVFDSALAPAAAATRASDSDERQLLFESDEYTLELSVDRSPEAEEAVLRGQLLEAHGEPRSHTPVFLMGGGEVLGRTISEEQGTFEIVGRLVRPCELWVFPDEEHHIKLRLDPDN